MRISNLVGSLPRPVLRPVGYESSYEDSDFKFEFRCDSASSPHKLELKYKIEHPDIVNLVRTHKATVGLAVHCEPTYYYEVFDVALRESQTITFDESLVFGNVYFCLVVKAIRPIKQFSPSKLQPAFSGLSFDIERGDFLAVSEEYQETYSLPALPLGESIFELVLQPEMEEDEFNVGLNEHRIQIGVGEKLNELLQVNMNTAQGRIKNISSVYFPALLEVLYQVQEESFDGKAWYESVGAAMAALGFDISNPEGWEPLQVSQRLLRSPFIRLLIVNGT